MSVGLNEIGGGGKSFPFNEIGDVARGRIVNVERRQQTSFDGNEKLTWDDGSPRMLTYIEIQTDLREDDDDEGIRALYAKGGNFEAAEGKGQSMEKAIVDAVKKAGCKSIDEGAELTVGFTGKAKPTTRGFQPAKLFVAQYKAPVASVSDDDLFAED
jgi:hypothetical protein